MFIMQVVHRVTSAVKRVIRGETGNSKGRFLKALLLLSAHARACMWTYTAWRTKKNTFFLNSIAKM
jgi:hypothetical protein